MNDDTKKSLLAVLIGGFIGHVVGSKLTKPASGVDPEISRLLSYIDEKLVGGVNADELTDALVADCKKQLKGKFTEDNAEKIKFFVLQEKVKLKEQGKL